MKTDKKLLVSGVVLLYLAVCKISAEAGELEVVNFDFGGVNNEPAYVGEGVLSTPGATHWNRVRNADLNSFFVEQRNEHNQPTDALIFSADSPNPLPVSWEDRSDPLLGGVFFEPASTGMLPSGILDPSEPLTATITLGRVQAFEEMVLYFAALPASSGPPNGIVFLEGGYTPEAVSLEIVEPLFVAPFSASVEDLPGAPGIQFARITSQPPRGGGLGERPTVTVRFSGNDTVLVAMQVRGVFGIVPEPAAALLGVPALACLLATRRRRHAS